MISDAILDECLSIDPGARVAVETMVKGTDSRSYIFIGGEVTIASDKAVDYERVARETAREIGYDDHSVGMDAASEELCQVVVRITQQSPDISQGVDQGKGLHLEQGAGDQGLMFGFASNETEGFQDLEGMFMPLPAALAQLLTSKMSASMKEGSLPWARPDSKSQVTIRYDDDGKPSSVDTVVIAIQHDDLAKEKFEGSEREEHRYICSEIMERVIKPVIPTSLLDNNSKIIINGTGRFVIGGPHADAGLTGRKIIVDTYGGMGRHGGGAFSGKDPSKVDRSAAYAARWAAKHVVASGIAEKCEIQLAYAIGVAEPVSVYVNTMGTGSVEDDIISRRVASLFDFRPQAIIEKLSLRTPIYSSSASGGHFGRNPDSEGRFSWESLDHEILESLKG
ncbi:MAG: S-adenosylmethionine synthase [Methanobacteriota archaeon]|nr:MAG: S-adenosylmethionine synthase [Euryarchaeota archaeon]